MKTTKVNFINAQCNQAAKMSRLVTPISKRGVTNNLDVFDQLPNLRRTDYVCPGQAEGRGLLANVKELSFVYLDHGNEL